MLLQHLTKLYAVHLGAVTQAFFYQQALRLWGNLAHISLAAPVALYDLARAGLADPASGYAPPAGSDAEEEADLVARGVVDLLQEKAEMVGEYLSVTIADGKHSCWIKPDQLPTTGVDEAQFGER